MAWLRVLPFWVAAICLGCGKRALDPTEMTGVGGVAWSGADGAASADALADQRRPLPDLLGIERFKEKPCGDGELDPGEQCDDGNSMSGDGCSQLCQLEDCWSCGSCGTNQPCVVTPVCGDGVLTPPEKCDDGNDKGGDGCSADCARIEIGWRCPVLGRRCAPNCGDGLVLGPETCDDGNSMSGDGCSDICVVEPATATCGDGIIEGAEECDDGAMNTDSTYDIGCTTQCRFAAYCGDGVVNGPEQCDLGRGKNVMVYGSPHGCSPVCTRPRFCGDGVVDETEGEQCDLGPDNGSGGSPCTTDCKIILP
jgi:cysteine-rich repeat protein